MRGVACVRATRPADVFTKRQFHKDNYEICEEDDHGDDASGDGRTGDVRRFSSFYAGSNRN